MKRISPVKYLLLIFTIALLVINQKETIQTILSPADSFNYEEKTIIKSPEIKTPLDSLNNRYTTIANKFNLPKSMNVHFVVDEKGYIRDPSFEEVDNSTAALKLIDLIYSAEVDPGSVSGKPVSMGTGLRLVSK